MAEKDIISEWARQGVELTKGKHGKFCNDCAFKKGTEANNDENIAIAAMECVAYKQQSFHCHTDEFKDNGVCKGFLYALEIVKD